MSQLTRLPPLNLNSDNENDGESQSSNLPSTARERRRRRILNQVVGNTNSARGDDGGGGGGGGDGGLDDEEEEEAESVRDKPPMGNKRRARRSRLASKESKDSNLNVNGGYDNKGFDSTKNEQRSKGGVSINSFYLE